MPFSAAFGPAFAHYPTAGLAARPLAFAIYLDGVDATTRCRVSGCSIVQSLNGVPDTMTLRAEIGHIGNPHDEITPYLTAGAGLATGAYRWVYTLLDAVGETAPSPLSAALFVTPAFHAFLLVPVGPVGTLSRKIYRQYDGGILGTIPLRFVATLADNITTTFEDNVPNATVAAGPVPPTSSTTGFSAPPVEGQTLQCYLGGLTDADLIFAGRIQERTTIHEGPATNVAFDLQGIDWTWQLNRRKVTKHYASQSATAIILDLIASFATGFTVVNVTAGLPTIGALTFTDADLTDALDQVMTAAGGYWFTDYVADIHAFLTDATAADPITDADPAGMQTIRESVDLSPVRTRFWVTGRSSNASAAVAISAAQLPVADGEPFADGSGTRRARLAAQRLTYTGVQHVAKLGSVTVGRPGTAPSGSFSATLASNHHGQLGVGNFNWKATNVSQNGETQGSSQFSGTVTSFGGSGSLSAAPVANAPGGLLPGTHDYAATFENANGETAYGTSYQGTIAHITAPGAATATATAGLNGFMAGGTYKYVVTYTDAGGETQAGTVATVVVAGGATNAVVLTAIPVSTDGRVTGRKIYRSTNAGGTTYFYLASLADNTINTYTDLMADAGLGVASPGSDTSGTGQMALTSISTGPTGTLRRHLYRADVGVAGGVSTLKRLASLNDNSTTTYTDTTPDASLGDLILATSTADGGQFTLSIATGPAGTTSRKIYRTLVGGSAFKLVATLNDNSTTAYTDDTPDASLGDDLGPGSIVALPGDTVLALVTASMFSGGNGWARAGSQVIQYAGVSGSSLTGIPASGAGSIATPISVGSEVNGEPFLSGVSGVVFAIEASESVTVLVMRESTAAQTALAALVGGDGIIEEIVSGGDVSIAELNAIGDANLALSKDPIATLFVTSRNPTIQVGRDQVVNLTQPPIAGTYKYQRITITELGMPNQLWPLRTAEASSRRFSLESLLRLLRKKAA